MPLITTRANASATGYGAFLAAAASTSFESIATVTVDSSSGASNIEFTSIPSTYKHLQIRGIVRGTGSISYQILRFNGDTGSNYADHGINANGSSVTTFYDVSNNTAGQQDVTATASIFTGIIIDILDYANTNKYKTLRTLSGYDTNGAGNLSFRSGLWMNSNAITSIKLEPNTNNYAQYSQLALYGIKGA